MADLPCNDGLGHDLSRRQGSRTLLKCGHVLTINAKTGIGIACLLVAHALLWIRQLSRKGTPTRTAGIPPHLPRRIELDEQKFFESRVVRHSSTSRRHPCCWAE